MEWRIVRFDTVKGKKAIETNDIKDVGDVVSRELAKDPLARIEIKPVSEGE